MLDQCCAKMTKQQSEGQHIEACWVREETDLFCVNSCSIFHLFKSIVPNMPILVALDCFVAARGN